MKRTDSINNWQSITEADFPRTLAAIARMHEGSLAPGAVVAAWNFHDDQPAWMGAWGMRRLRPSEQPLSVDTVFDLASLTKPLVTSTLVARLVERGLLSWRTPVSSVFQNAPVEWAGIEVWHLLSHTAGFRAWEPFWQEMRDHWDEKLPEVSVAKRQRFMRECVLSRKPEVAPGVRTLYSDLSFLILGFLVEEVSGLPLDRIWDELGYAAGFRRVHRSSSLRQPVDESVAATEESAWRGGVLQGEVHDENCWAMGGYAGHAGLFGSAGDLVRIVRDIFKWKLFSEATADFLFARVAPRQGEARTPGWDIPSGAASSVGPLLASRRGVVGHLGFTGTSLWVDRQTGWCTALLTGRVHLGRDNTGIRELRPLVHEALSRDLGIDRISSFERP